MLTVQIKSNTATGIEGQITHVILVQFLPIIKFTQDLMVI